MGATEGLWQRGLGSKAEARTRESLWGGADRITVPPVQGRFQGDREGWCAGSGMNVGELGGAQVFVYFLYLYWGMVDLQVFKISDFRGRLDFK